MLTTETFQARYPAGEGPDETEAARLIGAATAWLEDRTDRYFGEPVERVDMMPGNHTSVLWLKEDPIVPEGEEDVVVEADEAPYIGGIFEELEAGDFALRGRKVYRVLPALWYGAREYRFRYSVGYALDTGPEAVREAVAQIAEWLWNEQQAGAGNQGIRSERIGDYQYQLGGSGAERLREDIPFVWEVIRSWKRVPV